MKIKSFEKNPKKGGTPAIENKEIVINFPKGLLFEKLLKECVVLMSVFVTWNKVANKTTKEKLYINI